MEGQSSSGVSTFQNYPNAVTRNFIPTYVRNKLSKHFASPAAVKRHQSRYKPKPFNLEMCFTALERNGGDIDLPRSQEPANPFLTGCHLPHLAPQS